MLEGIYNLPPMAMERNVDDTFFPCEGRAMRPSSIVQPG